MAPKDIPTSHAEQIAREAAGKPYKAQFYPGKSLPAKNRKKYLDPSYKFQKLRTIIRTRSSSLMVLSFWSGLPEHPSAPGGDWRASLPHKGDGNSNTRRQGR